MRRSLYAARLGCCLAAALVSPQLSAAACEAASGPQRALLVELFTSEGCSSCPPADRWLSGLAPAARRGEVVPLAFHVDYWDDLGWRDRYAQAAFSRRQREAARRQGERTVFTPQVLADGRTLYDWHDPDALAERRARLSRANTVDLRLELQAGATPSVRLSARRRADASAAQVYLARWESGLESAVGAGENRGAVLRHDFVVREWIGPLPLDGDRTVQLERPSPAPGAAGGWAAVAWSADGSEVLQALALPLAACRGK